VFYTDAINTVISIMALYTVNVAVATGMTQDAGEEQAKIILMIAITFAVLGGFAWGWLADRMGPKRTLDVVLRTWMVIFVAFSCIGIFKLPIATLYVGACAAGFAMGGMAAADRPLMLRLTPPSRVGEFYGLYGMVGRFSAITGPLIWAAVTYLTINAAGLTPLTGQGIAVLTLLAMVVAGYVILRPVDDRPRKWNSEMTL
jgi:UMF1 family MFS transporter